MRRVVTIGLALLAGLAATPASAAPPRVPWLGVMADGPLTEAGPRLPGEWRRMARSGVGFARVAFYWDQIEPDGPGRPDWTATDALVARASRAGVDLLPVVLRAPAWAAVPTPVTGGFPPEAIPRDPADYGVLMDRLVRRYGRAGRYWRDHPAVPRRPITAWQVWNEPNLSIYWHDPDWAPGYTRLLMAAHAAIKRADPRATVVAAGLVSEADEHLRRLYGAGARGFFDVAALHVYQGAPGQVLARLERFRAAMRDAGDGGKPMWLTEFGWPQGLGSAAITPATRRAWARADRIRAVLPRVAAARTRLGIGRVAFYTWASRPNGVDWPTYAGLRRAVGDRLVSMPAYGRFVRAVRRLAGSAPRSGTRGVRPRARIHHRG